MPNQPYQYKPGDNPLDLANQHGITPNQLYSANPGGYPFTAGQVINLPTIGVPGLSQPNYSAPPPVYGPPAPAGPPKLVDYSKAPKEFQYYGQMANNKILANSPAFGPPAPLSGPQPNAAGQQYANAYLQGKDTYVQQQAADVANALSNMTQPDSMSQDAAASLGIDPSQHGYVLENGVWRYNPQAAAQAANAPTTGNNWQTNDRLHIRQFNKYAKNRQNRFITTQQWVDNAYRRKKQMAKGNRPSGKQQNNQQASPVTGFGLVDFGASSG